MELWKEDIAQLKEKGKAYTNTDNLIAFYGSSSVRLWETLADDLSPYETVNMGFGGSNYYWCDHYFEEVFAHIKPVRVILYAGDNDLGSDIPIQEIMNQVESLVHQVKNKFGDIPISIISVKPSPSRLYLKQNILDLNERLKQLMTDTNQGSYIDVHPAMLTESGDVRPDLFIEDQLHMNEGGYEIWARIVKAYLDSE